MTAGGADSGGDRRRVDLRLTFALCLFLVVACARLPNGIGENQSSPLQGFPLDPPAGAGSIAPNLALVGGDVAATWLEPVLGGSEVAHRLMFSRHASGSWSTPVAIAQGSDFFANWADLPAIVETGNGDLLAHWLAKTAADTYAYSIYLARSRDRGLSWQPLGKLNRDATDTEHGFVSWVQEGDGARAFWLDGREMATGGSMAVRTTLVEAGVGEEEVLDDRTCECCAIDAAITATGSLVLYRDRDEEETRDIAIVRRAADGWSAPEPIHVDGWTIEGCPVNGPAIAARGRRVAAAWFTAANGEPRVRLAFSDDAGETFERVIEIDGEAALGRVDTALDEADDALVVWMRRVGQEADILLQEIGEDGVTSDVTVVARTSASRASGFPRLVSKDGSIYVAWVDVRPEEPQQVRVKVFRARGAGSGETASARVALTEKA